MTRYFVFLLIMAGVLSAQSGSHPRDEENSGAFSSTVEQQLVGAWQLVRLETVRPNGEIIYPFYGKHPQGLLIYDGSGMMSVQIVSDPRPQVPTADSREAFAAAPQVDRAAAADGYYAYLGTWSVDEKAGTVTHHIQQSFYPGEWGEDGVRKLKIEGDMLTLIAKAHEMGEDHHRKLVWKRVGKATK
jgi:hypothetical protein